MNRELGGCHEIGCIEESHGHVGGFRGQFESNYKTICVCQAMSCSDCGGTPFGSISSRDGTAWSKRNFPLSTDLGGVAFGFEVICALQKEQHLFWN